MQQNVDQMLENMENRVTRILSSELLVEHKAS